MNANLTVEDILRDIEFELAQGMVAYDDLGEAIQNVRKHQNKTRAEFFKSMKGFDPQREYVSRQFQINDMLLNLLEAMARNIQELQVSIQKLRQMPKKTLQATSDIPVNLRTSSLQAHPESLAATQSGFGLEFRSTEEVEYIMRSEAIHVDLQARPFRLPIIGWLLTKLRILYQRPALFYTQLLESRQVPVNRVLGDRILYLESLVQTQQLQIQALHAQLTQNAPPQAQSKNTISPDADRD